MDLDFILAHNNTVVRLTDGRLNNSRLLRRDLGFKLGKIIHCTDTGFMDIYQDVILGKHAKVSMKLFLVIYNDH